MKDEIKGKVGQRKQTSSNGEIGQRKLRESECGRKSNVNRNKCTEGQKEYPGNPRIEPAILIGTVDTIGSSGLVASFPNYP